MALITTTAINDGGAATAASVQDQINAILAQANGNLDSDNLAAGAVGTSELAAGSVTQAKLSADVQTGWVAGVLTTPTTITNNGNRSYDLVFNGVDYTQELSEGMRLKLTRTVTAPTQSTSLNGTTQYWSKSSPAGTTFTDDFCTGAWVYLTSYPTAEAGIITRYNGTSGWALRIATDGRVVLAGNNAGSSNSSYVLSYQSLPLNKWVHVSAQLDMSAFTATTTTSYIMFDGVDIPALVARGGTNPTALVQAGNLEIGTFNSGAGGFFPGKIAQAWYSSAKITQANIRTLMSQGLTTSLITTHSIVSAYSFNGVATDLNTTSANDLSAQASAAYTSDSPFAGGSNSYETAGTTEYAQVVAKPTFSTNTTVTVRTNIGSQIPTSGGVSAVAYSTQHRPFGYLGDDRVLGYSETRVAYAPTLSDNTYGDVNGLSTTVVVPSGGRDVFVTIMLPQVKSDAGAGTVLTIALREGSTILGQTLWNQANTGYNLPLCLTVRIPSPSAGSHTYKVSAAKSSGNLTIAGGMASSTLTAGPMSILVESL